ncbi:MAG: hypothetical protein K8T91_22730 [Planctomycetes bacterium]|nr:hypothetical protein [Planctomycetota bacterium]
MQNFLYIAGGIAFILFFVGLGLSYRTWRIHTLLLMPAVFIMAVVFLCLLVQTLKTHQQWGELQHKLEDELKTVQKANKELEFGQKQPDEKIIKEGIKQLKERLVDTTRDRGRMWLGCQPSSVDPASGEVKITVPVPKEHQIKAKMLVYAFEDRPTGGAYLGAFRVTNVIGGDAPMEEPMAEAKAARRWPQAGQHRHHGPCRAALAHRIDPHQEQRRTLGIARQNAGGQSRVAR